MKSKRDKGSEPHEISSSEAIVWEQKMPLLTNLFFLKDFMLTMAATFIVMQVLFLVISIIIGEDLFFLPLGFILILIGILSALFVISILLVLQNRFGLQYTVDANGVSYDSGSREKKINRVVFWLSLLSGKPGPIGSSLLARSQESRSFSWRDIYSVTLHPRAHAITLNNSWRTILRLYCTPENFEKVAERVQAYAADGASWRASNHIQPPRYGFYVKWLGLTATSFIASLVWLSGYDVGRTQLWTFYWEAENLGPLALIVSLMVLLSGVFEGKKRIIAALIATAGSLLFVARLASLALGQYIDSDTAFAFQGYEVDPWLMVISFAGGSALVIMSASRLLMHRD
ncbi:MAG: hypothetical protein M1503_05325 [Thaumarchaeota archaeon]|nr:hypothetical protein [Nitrososphaerota archaeon]MCL5317672.1 hypothetical protein [Nitrososphaerota archaeon]